MSVKGIIFGFSIISLVIIIMIFRPLVIDNTRQERLSVELTNGDTVKPFSGFDFSQGNWKAVIIVDADDNSELKGSILYSCDEKLLNKIKGEWVFTYTGADITTVGSKMLLYKEDSLVYLTNISTDKVNNGLQNMSYGWLASKDDNKFISLLEEFERGYSPIYIFN